MNEEEYYQALKILAQSKRKEFLNSQEYASKLLDIMLQVLNLKDSPWRTSDLVPYKFTIELISLYQDYLNLHESDFQHKDMNTLQNSLENSIYCTIEPQLVLYEINKLIPSKEESLLIIPLTISQYNSEEDEWFYHEVGSIIQKKSSYLELRIIDKSSLYIPTRKNIADKIYAPNSQSRGFKTIVDYYYQIPLENSVELSKILMLGINSVDQQKRQILLSPLTYECLDTPICSNIKDYLLTKISTLASKEYYGTVVSAYQALGNCLSKELDATLKIALGVPKYSKYSKKVFLSEQATNLFLSEQKIPNVCSTSKIYLSLISILMDRLESLKFSKEEFQPLLTDMYYTYKYLKNCRQTSPLKKRLQTKLTKRFYKKCQLNISKLETTAMQSTNYSKNLDYLKQLCNELDNRYTIPKSLEGLHGTVKKQPFYKQKKYTNSITDSGTQRS